MYLIVFSPSLFFGLPEKTQWWWLVIVSYITITFPLLVVFLLWRLKFIESIYMQGDKERYIPLISSMLFYFWTFWSFHKELNAPVMLQRFLLGTFLLMIGVFMATIFFKISMHSAAWGGVVSFALLATFQHVENGFLLLLISLVLSGIVAATRLFLKAHTPVQVYTGFFAGVLMQLLSFFVVHHFLIS